MYIGREFKYYTISSSSFCSCLGCACILLCIEMTLLATHKELLNVLFVGTYLFSCTIPPPVMGDSRIRVRAHLEGAYPFLIPFHNKYDRLVQDSCQAISVGNGRKILCYIQTICIFHSWSKFSFVFVKINS